MKSFKFLILIILYTSFYNQDLIFGQKKFQISSEKEAIILGSSAALILSSLILEKNIRINPQEIFSLSVNDINSFDRSAVNYYSKNLSVVSDVLMITSVSLPVSFILMKEAKSELKSIGILYLETLTLTYGITNLTKNIFQRFRPYAYNQSVNFSEKLDLDTKKSFFSGHTSISFASAVFFSTVFSELGSDEKMKIFVWISSLSIATSTGLLRYFSGKHFPTDIIAGAIVGSLIGYTIPKIHKSEGDLNFNLFGNQNLISISIGFDSRFLR
ncbi:MAG: phosphatase PAP2 family protein [Ignavibacteria bacterium]